MLCFLRLNHSIINLIQISPKHLWCECIKTIRSSLWNLFVYLCRPGQYSYVFVIFVRCISDGSWMEDPNILIESICPDHSGLKATMMGTLRSLVLCCIVCTLYSNWVIFTGLSKLQCDDVLQFRVTPVTASAENYVNLLLENLRTYWETKYSTYNPKSQGIQLAQAAGNNFEMQMTFSVYLGKSAPLTVIWKNK